MLTPSPLFSRHRHDQQNAAPKPTSSTPSADHRSIRLIAMGMASLALASSITVLSGAILKNSLALADPCSGGGGGFGCGLRDGGGSGGGGSGGSGGSGGGGGDGEIPKAPRDDGSLLPENEDGPAGTGNEPLPTIYWAEVARSQASLPVPGVSTAPSDKTYVGLRTALWVSNFRSVETPRIGDGDQRVWAVATPKHVIWDLGEKTMTCDGAGSAGTLECSYTYNRSSASVPDGAHRIIATIVWGLTWHCQGSDCDDNSGTLDDMTMSSAPYPLVVSEIQANSRP